MSSKKYPVIDVEKCIECGACYEACKHKVYEIQGTRPLVVRPENCRDNCRACQMVCPVGAITYSKN